VLYKNYGAKLGNSSGYQYLYSIYQYIIQKKEVSMENILLKYMVERFNLEQDGIKIQQKNLPFITISREYGCPAKDVAAMIVARLNVANEKIKNFQAWTWISKDILQAASSELNIDTSRIDKIFNDEKRGTIDEILNALSDKYYQSDRKILKTIDKGHL